jgi:hypothetical protein
MIQRLVHPLQQTLVRAQLGEFLQQEIKKINLTLHVYY